MEQFKFMFRIHENPAFALEAFKKILKFSYRLIVCFEDKDKQGEDTRGHYHGYVEMDSRKSMKQNYDKLKNILKKYISKKDEWSIKQIGMNKDDEKGAMAYTTKQGNVVEEYNTSYEISELKDWYKNKQKDDALLSAKARVIFQDRLVKEFFETKCDDVKQLTIASIKIWVAHKICNEGKMPVMSKVRAYTMYIISKCNLTHFLDCEIEKLL